MIVEQATRTFPRSARLTAGAQFKRVFGQANRRADSCFVVLATSSEGSSPRLGMAIGKRISPRAVHRNRLKRLIRETFRNARDSLPAMDFVVMARSGANRRSNEELLASLSRHWHKQSQSTTVD